MILLRHRVHVFSLDLRKRLRSNKEHVLDSMKNSQLSFFHNSEISTKQIISLFFFSAVEEDTSIR